MVLTLEAMGFDIEAAHHECAPAQHEIDFKYDEALRTADNIITFKLAVKTIAKNHGLHATFMPKPRADVNGSGMHTDMSLYKDGINVFYNPEDEKGLSQEAYYFMGGIMKHIQAITAIANPLVNSYKRLVPGYEAPSYVTWSDKNRNSLIRIPAETGEETRIELRSPDPSANPYLLWAVCLAAGLQGIREKEMPPKAITKNVSQMTQEERKNEKIAELPKHLIESLDALEQDEFIKSILGEQITKRYLKGKKQEWEEYISQVTSWEIENYLYRI